VKESKSYEFANFRLIPDECVLLKDDVPIELTGKAFDLLVLLVKHHGSLVRKGQIIVEIWPDTHGGNIHVLATAIRNAMGVNYIESVPNRGYRFTAEVKECLRSDEAAVPKKGRRWSWVIGGSLAAVAVAVAGGIYVRQGWRIPDEPCEPRSPVALSPRATTLYDSALKYHREGSDEQALAALDQAVVTDPTYAEAYLKAAYISFEYSKDDDSEKYLSKALEFSGNRGERFRLKAKAFGYEIGENETKAAETYRILLDTCKPDSETLYQYGGFEIERGHLADGQKSLRMCLDADPDNADCNYAFMQSQLKANDFQGVLMGYADLQRRGVTYTWFDELAGLAFLGEDRVDEGVTKLNSLAANSRSHGMAHLTVAREWTTDLELYQGHIADGLSHLEQLDRAAETDSEHAAYEGYLSKIHLLLGHDSEAHEYAKQASSRTAAASTRLSAATVFAYLGDKKAVRDALDIGGGKTLPVDSATQTLIDGMLKRKTNINGAIDTVSLAYQMEPSNLETGFLLALLEMQGHRWNDASKLLSLVTASKGRVLSDYAPFMWPLAHYYLGLCYDQLSRNPEAAQSYSRFLTVWKAADASIPTVRLARERIHSLGIKPS
jgi:DNA-binding winged helix-turn-helix (wHTH) protein/tetratricopeptide (TPR) repeat protein